MEVLAVDCVSSHVRKLDFLKSSLFLVLTILRGKIVFQGFGKISEKYFLERPETVSFFY